MAKLYSCEAPEIERKTFFFRTPGIAELRHALVVRQLVQERVRCFLDDIPFSDMSLKGLVRKFMVIPTHYETEAQRSAYFESEFLEVMTIFKLYEAGPTYQEDLRLLHPYRGHRWTLRNATAAGVLIVIEV